MIPRYSREVATRIWSAENRYQIWLDIEIAACEAFVKQGVVPEEDLDIIKERASFSVERIDEIEKVVKHDVIAFLTNVNESIGAESRHLHMGMTSSDVLDTSLAKQLKESADLILADIELLLAALKERAFELKDQPMMGRSHGIHAEPVTMGLKFALWYAEFKRNKARLIEARQSVAVGKISGAVGTYANIDPQVEAYVCHKLGLTPESVSTQVVQRDRHAHFFTTLAVIAGSIEKIAVEIRHLQRTEVSEAEEPFTAGQKGSSAMPHKRNPILSENLTGLSRLIRSNAMAALENIALWHERDISHSSVERVIAPDSCILMDFMLHRLTGLIKELVIYPEHMKANLERSFGLIFSQQVLLALVGKGMSREQAYSVVQRSAMESWSTKTPLLELLKKDSVVNSFISGKELESLFDINHHLRHVNTIFSRVFDS